MKSKVCTGEKCEIDKNFQVQYCAEEFANSLGHQEHEVVGKRLFFGEDMVRSLRETGKYSGYAVVLGANDSVYYVSVNIESHNERYVVRDIEIQSVVNMGFWEKMFRKMPLPVMVLSRNHTIVDVNDELLKLVGKPRDELLGTKCHVLMHGLPHPPPGCPLYDAVKNGLEHNLNIMDTVFGEFLISVVKIDENLYAHYPNREVALLMDMQHRMVEFLKRYNRILIAATTINEEVLAGSDVDGIIQNIGEKIKSVGGFHGAAVYIQRNGNWEEGFSFNISLHPDEIIKFLDSERVVVIEKDGINHYAFAMHNMPRRVIFVLNMGGEKLTEDEINTIQSSLDHLGEYIVSKILEEKREMAYKYISDVMSDFAMLVDRIRNPLATLSLSVEMQIEHEELRKMMMEKISEIQEITKKIDELWNRAEEMQKVLKGD